MAELNKMTTKNPLYKTIQVQSDHSTSGKINTIKILRTCQGNFLRHASELGI